MEKQEKYYKFCTIDDDGNMRSISDVGAVYYNLNEKSVPLYGKLFLYSTERDALAEITNYSYPLALVEGTVEGNVYDASITHYHRCYCDYNYQVFWGILNIVTTENDLIDVTRKFNVGKYVTLGSARKRVELLDIKSNSLVFADDFTPTKILQVFSDTGEEEE